MKSLVLGYPGITMPGRNKKERERERYLAGRYIDGHPGTYPRGKIRSHRRDQTSGKSLTVTHTQATLVLGVVWDGHELVPSPHQGPRPGGGCPLRWPG